MSSALNITHLVTDDEFSTLNGQGFEWNLLPDTEFGQNLAPAHNILRILTFSESNYAPLPHIKALEASGKRGDRILVRGIRTGSARISARLDDPVYKVSEGCILVRGSIYGSVPGWVILYIR